MSSDKYKLKWQRDTTKDLLEWPKSGKLTTSTAGDNMERQELLLMASGKANSQFVGFLQFNLRIALNGIKQRSWKLMCI